MFQVHEIYQDEKVRQSGYNINIYLLKTIILPDKANVSFSYKFKT